MIPPLKFYRPIERPDRHERERADVPLLLFAIAVGWFALIGALFSLHEVIDYFSIGR